MIEEPGKNTEFADKAKALFDDSVERLDAQALSRLNRGRHEALAEIAKAGPERVWLRWAPATGIAAAAVVTVLVMRGPDSVDIIEQPVTATDFELLLEGESLEMLEDLEFFVLLDEVAAEANGNVG